MARYKQIRRELRRTSEANRAHPARALWDIHRHQVAAEVAELYARVLALPKDTWAEELAAYKEFYGGAFDIRARAYMVLISPAEYSQFLSEQINAVLSDFEHQPLGMVLLPHIRPLLAQR